MDTIVNGVMLAFSLIAGITIGARLSRANHGFIKSLILQALLFAAICAASLYLAERPVTLACIVCGLASIIAAWLGCKTAPETASSASYLGMGSSAVDNPMRVDSADNPFDRSRSHRDPPKAASSWTRPLARFGRQPKKPSRLTPTGNTIRLVSSTDVVRGTRRGDLNAVK